MPYVLTLVQGRYLRRHLEARVLRRILKQVSRSFYLSLSILAGSVRQSISLAYLFCRTADTIVDTPLYLRHQRWQTLQAFRKPFLSPYPHFETVLPLPPDVDPSHSLQAEQQLTTHLPQCFTLWDNLPKHDRQLIAQLVLCLTHGMEMDLTYFNATETSPPRAFPDMATLDLYTYYVAGAVGEFWTKIHQQHLHRWQTHGKADLCSLAIHFGKGLQMTNILKDVGKDLALGRCYLPNEQLTHIGLNPEALLCPASLSRLRPLLIQLIWHTLTHLDQACTYVMQLPYHAIRLRLSCMWPLLFAIQTLEVVYNTDQLLCATARVKISRHAVYRTLWISCLCLLTPGLFLQYYATLRRNLSHTLTASLHN
jgi:farnesyl-diphosphate farnesyltransferase